ncbi:MAG: acetate kinase, partial [Propionibacteriaceae bacterium]
MELIDAGDARAKLGFDVYVHRLVFYIGAYIALLGGIDAVTFTAGVGENNPRLREAIVQRLEHLGLTVDPAVNDPRSKEPRRISAADGKVAVLVIPTNEELQMARYAKAAIGA